MQLEPLAIVTGASQGIGKELARLLLDDISVLCIANSGIEQLRDQIGAHPNFYGLELDLTSKEMPKKLQQWFDEVGREFEVSYLVHNAGILEVCPLDSVTYENIVRSFSINTFAPMLLNKYFFKENKFSQSSRVLYITSSAARLEYGRIYAGLSLYSATKAAINEVSLIQKRECEVLNCKKNLLIARAYPGVVMTEMQRYLQETLPDPMISELKTLPEFIPEMFKETILPKCILQPSVSAMFLYWVLKLPKKDYLQSAEFDIYRDEWMKPKYINEVKNL